MGAMVRIRRPGVGVSPDWYRPMRARDGAEQHRGATPLELLFDRIVPGGIIVFDDYVWLTSRAQYEAEKAWFAVSVVGFFAYRTWTGFSIASPCLKSIVRLVA